MSLKDDASLILIPSAYKTGQVFMQKPLPVIDDSTGNYDGTDPAVPTSLDFTRASNATRVNSEGLIESVASGVPRLDYLGGATCPRLLLEPQATSLNLYSEQLDNAAWIKNNATITDNATTSPDGYANADKVMASAGNAAHSVYQIYNGPNGIYTHSAFFKAGEYSYAFLRAGGVTGSPYVIYNLATQAAVSSAACTHKIEAYGNGWFRISLVPTNLSGLHATNVMFLPSSGYTLDTANVPSWNADGTSGGYVWGVNLTQTSYVTSYIPTLGTSVTRVADACFKNSITSFIGQTEGVIYAEVEMTEQTAVSLVMSVRGVGYGDSQNFYFNQFRQVQSESYTSFVAQEIITSGAYEIGQRLKIALAYKTNDFALYINGVQIGTDTSGTIPASMPNLLLNPYNKVYTALLFKTRLPNATLASLTTP